MRIWKKIGIGILVLLGVIVVIVLALQTGPVRNYALSKLRSVLAAQGIDLQASSLDYSLLNLSATLHNVVVRSTKTPELPPVLSAHEAYINLALIPLLHHVIEVEDAHVTDPAIHIVVSSPQTSNIPGQSSSKSGNSYSFQLDHFAITGGSLVFDDRPSQLKVDLPGWQATMNERGGQRSFDFSTQRPGQASMQNRSVGIQEISLRGAMSGNNVSLSDATVRAAGSQLRVHGKVNDLSSPNLDIAGAGDIAIEPAASFAGVKSPASGNVQLQFTAQGPLDHLQTQLRAESRQLKLANLSFIKLDAQATYDGQAQKVELPALNVNSNIGSVQAAGKIGLSNAAGESAMQARLTDVDLGTITHLLDSKLKIASRATGTAHLTWPGLQFRKIDGRAFVHLTKLAQQPKKGVLPLAGDIVANFQNGTMTFSIGQKQPSDQAAALRSQPPKTKSFFLRRSSVVGAHRSEVIVDAAYYPDRAPKVRIVRASFEPSSVPLALFQAPASEAADNGGGLQAVQALATLLRGKVTITADGHLAGKLHAHVTDLSDLLSKLAALQGTAPPIGTKIAGEADITANLSGTLKEPAADLTVTAPGLTVGNLKSVSLHLEGKYTPAVFLIRTATASWRNQELTLQGTVPLDKKHRFDLDAQVTNAQIAAILEALQKTNIPASGVLALKAHVSGTVKKPEATADITGSDLQAYGEPWGQLNAAATLKDDELNVQQFRLEKAQSSSGAGSLGLTATYNLKSKSYTLKLNGDAIDVQHLQLPSGKKVSGTFNLNAQGQGTVADPSLVAKLQASSLTYDQQNIGALGAQVDVNNGRARIQAQAPAFNLSTTADVGIHAPYAAKLSLNANGVNLAALPLPASAGNVQGSISLNAQASGDLQRPAEMNAALAISQMDVTRNGLHITSEGPVDVAYKNNVLRVEPAATLVASGSRFTIQGTLPLKANTQPANLHITGSANLTTVREMVPSLQGYGLGGNMDLDLTVAGTLKDLRPQGTLKLTNGFFGSPSLPTPVQNMTMVAQFGAGVISLQTLTADWAGSKLSAQGDIPFKFLSTKLPIQSPKSQLPARLTLNVTGLQLEHVPKAPENVSGTISLNLDVTASKPALDALQARLEFTQLDLQANKIPIQQQGPSVITVSNGNATVEHFQLKGPDTLIELAGTAGLMAPRTLNLRLDGKTNAALASMFVSGLTITGPTTVQVAATGSVQNPNLQGFVAMQHGHLAMKNPDVAATELNLRFDLNGERVTLSHLSGTLNGGTLSGGGGLTLARGGPKDVNLQVNANEVYLNYPDGLRTMSDLHLTFTSQADLYVLGGNVSILDGTFRRYVNIQTQILDLLQTGSSRITLIGQQSPFLAKIRFNLPINTKSPVLVDNNLAKAAIVANLKLVGGYYRPSVTGRVQLDETGQLFLSGHTFYVNTGIITLTSEERIEPTVNLQAETQVDNYDITMQVQGPAGKIKTTLTSDPVLSEQDIVSVLVFGQPLQAVRGAEVNVASQEMLAYVAGGLGGVLSSQLQKSVGISEVQIQPSLIAGEANPNVRVTIGQNVTSALKLIYSMNVVDPGDQIWIGQYNITRRFQTSITKQSDNSYRLDLSHLIEFGGTPLVSSAKQKTRTISSLEFVGNTVFPEHQLRDDLKAKPGDKYDFFKIQKGIDRIQSHYYRHSRLEARVRLHTVRNPSKVDIRINVSAGPVVRFAYEGWNAPHGLRERVQHIWRDGVFELQRAQDSVAAIRTELVKEGYLEGKIKYQVKNPVADERQVVFDIQPGKRYSDVQVRFPGASQIPGSELLDALKDAKLKDLILVDPDRVKTELQNYYRNNAFLSATVDDPRVHVDANGQTGAILIPVHEGKRYRVASVKFTGNHVFPETVLEKVAQLSKDVVFNPQMVSPAIVRVQDAYWNLGYNNMTVQYVIATHPQTGLVDLVFPIVEGKQQVLHTVNVSGTDQTSPSLVRDLVHIRPGEPVSTAKVSKTRSDLYDTGAYQIVEMNRSQLPQQNQAGQVPTDLNISVHEVRPFRLQYGGYFDTDRGPGFISDISNKNSLGDARQLGLRLRYDADLQDSRLYFNQPLFFGLQLQSTGEGFFTRNVHSAFIDDHIGITAGQQFRFRKDYLINYSYRLERTRVFNLTDTALTGFGPAPGGGGPEPPPLSPGVPIEGIGSDITVPPFGSLTRRIAPVTLTLTRDTRDNVLDATKGLFYSHGFSNAFGFLGSQQHYLKYFGQYYQFIPLGKPRPMPFQKGVQKVRLVYAGALRIGLAGGLGGQSLIQSERFFAGGGTTIRGFRQDQVGPIDQQGIPVGGNALFILNNELRFPLFSVLDGAGFIDIGNVYPTVSDFNPFHVRKAAGPGIRIQTPWVTLRLDYGIKLDRKPGESFGQFFFGIGQAF